jgi:hypothetical protein
MRASAPRNAAGTLFNAGNMTGAGLSALDQARLANQQAGITAAGNALGAENCGPMQQLAVARQQYGLPLQNLAKIAGIADPMASQFATTNSNGTTREGAARRCGR